MSLGYGPAPLTPGTPAKFQINRNSVAVQIRNFSRYFVGVYFGANLPEGSTTTTLAPGFHTVIAPGEQPVLAVVGNYTQDYGLNPNGLIEFTGEVYLLPVSIDPNLGLTGGMSSNYATVTSYLSGETLPASTAAPRIVDSSSQQRVVTIATGAEAFSGVVSTPTAGSDTLIRTDAMSAANIAAGTVNCYLYYVYLTLRCSVVSTGASAEYLIFFDIMNGASVVTSTFFFESFLASYQGASSTPQQTDKDKFQPAGPAWGPIRFTPGGATAVRYRIHWQTVGGTFTVWYNVGTGIDLVNSVTPGSTGNFTPSTGLF